MATNFQVWKNVLVAEINVNMIKNSFGHLILNIIQINLSLLNFTKIGGSDWTYTVC